MKLLLDRNGYIWCDPVRGNGVILEKLIRKIKRIYYCFFILPKKCKADLLVAFSPTHPNLGDLAILLAEMHFLKQFGEVAAISNSDYKRCRSKIPEKTLIILSGGGNLGDIWIHEEEARRNIIKNQMNNPKILFPQSFYYGDQRKIEESLPFYRCENLWLTARDDESYSQMKKIYGDRVIETPDIVLSASRKTFNVKQTDRSGVLFCFRSDKEKKIADEDIIKLEKAVEQFSYTDMLSDVPVTEENRMNLVSRKMNEFAGAELVITDRLHGMIFSALTETPCIVLQNSYYKVKGQYRWLSHLPYITFFENVDDALSAIPSIRNVGNCHFEPLTDQFLELGNLIVKMMSDSEKCHTG